MRKFLLLVILSLAFSFFYVTSVSACSGGFYGRCSGSCNIGQTCSISSDGYCGCNNLPPPNCGDCSLKDCSYNGSGSYGICNQSTGNCGCTTPTNTSNCIDWSGWGACSGGWQYRECQAPAGVNDTQVQACTPEPTGIGGTPGPTSPPFSTPRPTSPPPTPTPTPTPIPAPVLSCSAIPSGINWSWNTWAGITSFWLQVWGDVWKANSWGYTSPTFTTGTPGVTYNGRVAAGDGTQTSNWSNTASCTVPAPSTPTGACGSFNSNPANPATPVTWTWTNGTGIQVWDSTGHWWYNAAATSPLVIDNIPPGRIVYARTTYNFSFFSATANTTCALPANPAPVTIQGTLQQKSGIGCNPANATDNFNVQNPTATTNPSSCVVTSCTVSPNNNAAQTYTCTTTFSSNNCLNNSPPTWPTSATVTLTGIAPPGYTLVGWTPNGSCDSPVNTKTVNNGDTINNQPLTFNFSGENWIKLKNSSFNGVSVTSITVPSFVTNYDTDDDGSKYFIIGVGGSVLNTTVFPNSDPLNLHYSNPNNWYSSSYSAAFPMNPTVFSGYVKARKQYTKISALDQITADGIYIWDETVAFPDITNTTSIPSQNFVLISTVKPITISRTNFNPTKSVAIVANNITFGATTQTANGIFIAQTVNTGSNSNMGLKIKGNLIAQSTLTNDRSWSDTSRPGFFIVFDPVQYINLLPYLSTASYDWRQIQ